MLRRILAFSIHHAGLVVVCAGLLLALAVARIASMPVDVFPELNAPTVVVMTEAGGLAADEVESTVTIPIETAVNGLPGARRVRSASATSLSIVWVEFDWGSDLHLARQMVAERLAGVQDALPADVHAEIAPLTSITGEIMLLALRSKGDAVSPLDLRTYAEFDLRPRLLAVSGIAQVSVIGGELPQYQIEVRPERLTLHGISIDEVVSAASEAHSTAGAGYLANVDHLELPVRQLARVRSVEDIRATLVRSEKGAAITIGDVADVVLGPAPKRGTAADRGMAAVVLSVQKAPGTNTLLLTEQLDSLLDRIEPTLPPGMELNREVFRASRFIDRSIDNVVHVLRDATIIVVAILVLFLMNLRTTIITLTALPVSLAAAILVLDALGHSLNVMTLGGLAVAIGALVDDAIIDVENVYRRLNENAARPADRRRPLATVVLEASNEIRPSIVFATVIICLVFVPLLFLHGLEGRFFRPLAIAYIVSTLASLAVALTLTPALCRLVLRGRAGATDASADGFVVRWLKAAYAPSLAHALRRRWLVLGASAALALGALLLGSRFGTAFLPTFNEGTFTVFLMAPPGTSLEESDRLAKGVERRLAAIPGVESVTRRTGRAERDEHAEPVSSSEIEVTFGAGHDRDAVRRAIDEVLAGVPGITTMVGQPIEHRLSHMLSGTPAAIAINVYGDDLETLRSVAKEIETELRGIEGARDVNANREVMVTSLPIRYRHQDLAAAGLTPAAAAREVQRMLHGEKVAEIADGARRIDLVVRLAPEERERVEQLAELPLHGSGGARVRLGQVADIGPERTSNLVARENARRKAVVSCNVAEGHNLGDLVAEVRERVDPLVRRAGCDVSYGGQFEAQRSAARTIGLLGAAVALVMFLLLQLSTGSARTAALVMVNLPLALIGGVAAIYLSESPSIVGNTLALAGLSSRPFVAPVLSIASMVGFVSLFGIAVRNGLLLVNHYDHLRTVEGASVRDAVVRGSEERLVPILMTALTAALGLLPLAWAGSQPGSELLAPLAVVVLGGLLSSTALNLIVVPVGYALVHRESASRMEALRSTKVPAP